MPLASIKISRNLLVFALLFCFYNAGAQVKYDAISFRIDSLANIGLPKSALKEVDKLDKLARKNDNAPQQVRAVIYRMTFQSYLEEDALAAIISRLRTDIDKAAYPVKPVLQSLLGQMYWNYYQQNRYQFGQRTRLEKPDTDFAKWDLQTLITQTGHLYDLSLTDAAKEQTTPISVLDGVLEGDSTTRYLRPTLYDLLVQRAFDFFLADEAGLTKPKLPFSLNDPRFFGDSQAFADLLIKTTDTASTAYKGLKYLQQASKFHLGHHDEEALADLDLQRLKFLYARSNVEHKDSLYLSALKQITEHFSAKPISSEALVLQGQYYQGLDSLAMAYGFFKKAAAAYPNSLGGKNAATLMRQIEEKELSATVEEVNSPDKPILALLNYKNLTGMKLAVYRLSESQLNSYTTGFSPDYSRQKISGYHLDYLKKLAPVQAKTIFWTDFKDFKKHSLEFKIDALRPGNYVLLITDTSGHLENLTGLSSFRVSGLAYNARANPDNVIEVRVMDRETGKPLSGVKINLETRNNNYNSSTKKNEWVIVDAEGFSDRNGLYKSAKFSSGYGMSVSLTANGDTLKDKSKYINGARDDSSDDGEPDDKTIFFTDRQIYRPGQTIYFKALQLQSLHGKSKIMAGKNVEVQFWDANNKQVSAVKLKTNDFGTVGGSFIIPQSTLGGNVALKTQDGEIEVKVEEYKRPTFQVKFLPVKESYKLNDSVVINGNITAFSGYGLSQAKVAYNIVRSRNGDYTNYKFIRGVMRPNYNNDVDTEIKSDTITSDDQGHFQIKFKAVTADSIDVNSINYNYAINADITDASGETHSGETTVIIGNNNIKIDNYLPEQVFAKDSLKEEIKITNLNGEPQKGEIRVEVYPLKGPDRVFKNRLWQGCDQFIISKSDFRVDFPGYAYAKEDVVELWNKLGRVISLNLKLDTLKPGIINLSALGKQPSGMYQVILHATNEKGDTSSVTKYINLIADQPKIIKIDKWVIPVLNYIKQGDTASFLVGTDQKINVLMEHFNGPKLISSKWITINKGQQNIKIPIDSAEKDVAVQFMMVFENRTYASYQKIYIANAENSLKIKLLTFRDKLQPGEKEQWKLRVSNQNNEQQAAEMVAGLYDASLDDITPATNWNNALELEGGGIPNYYEWNVWDFIRPVKTLPVNYLYTSYELLSRSYERLNMFGYNYYGGNNNGYENYLKKVNAGKTNADNNKRLQEEYLKNAARVKNGYDIIGRVISADDKTEIPGVTVKIKGTSISTQTNSAGYFKIRVPVNGTLAFSFVGYKPQEVITAKAGNISVTLNPSSNALNEVVVTAYGVQMKKELTGSVSRVMIRGIASPSAAMEPDDTLAGQASGFVVMREIRTAPGVKFDKELLIRKPIIPRTNFNETAFFYPQLHTDEKGQILIDFTIPEALTRWKFRSFAHTQDLKTGYIENTVVTQKQLSISANTPRFLREGDTITISARLANLTAGTLKGKVQMQLFNALNMQPVSLFVNKADAEQTFEVATNTNKAVSFRLVIPAGLDALDYKLTADAGNFTDGEENTLPVLPNRTLVTESMPMMVRPGQTREFTFDKLVNQSSSTLKNKTLTLEYTQNPAWYAVQALPYMMEFPYECSEQVFSRYYANSLATNLVSKMPAIKQVFEQWKMSNSTELLSNLEKNQELKSTLLEETPWLRDAVSESEQKKRIALLFDLNKMSDELKTNLDKLQKRQLPDGSFTWFGGDRGDRYITQHIAEGMGELYHLGIGTDDAELKQISDNTLKYLDDQLTSDEKLRKKNKDGIWLYGDLEIHAWFARSYFFNKPLDKGLNAALANYLKWAAEEWKFRNVYEQGMIALTMQRYKKPDVTAQIERSLLETAQQSDDMGMYWAKNQQGYFWYESPVETQSLLIELFTEAGNNTKAVDEMKIWLLRNKQTNDWKTTKATAAACYALLLKGSSLLADTGQSAIKLDGKTLEELKPEIKADAGTGYLKTSWADEQIRPALGKVEIKNNSTSISWGALHWQYLENLDKITSSATNIKLERKYFIQKQTDAGPVLTAVDATHKPKTGDLLKVVVYLNAERDFEYVQLKDLRPAGTEPVDALSTYKYQDGLSYYQVTKDVATNFFISYLNKGNYVFEYRLRVAQPGNFSTGITSVQCMYAPEFNAHSQGGRMAIKP
ncbi:alpha-2-macroglobulin family protein [Mucilaginibacter gotjawali]|uniref:Uncharacterized protein YfaS (Alpha-2-macroglobulin family) n=1 Tax=Mucilaginibacter gotjawali TaxID=1550579 RepID=A0A839SQ57_9SPHI|nr:alpha-2-macroglobulin family protein [Mucilaginibacter gotjawali]MBB3058960.1 uncharacterized protein YfaS (alpha-2-macroglobulin family) [Mucilaginibacter gotjawali]